MTMKGCKFSEKEHGVYRGKVGYVQGLTLFFCKEGIFKEEVRKKTDTTSARALERLSKNFWVMDNEKRAGLSIQCC